MKKGIISFLIVLVFIFSLYGNTEELAQSYDLYDGEVSTNPNRTLGGRQFTSEGQVKVLLLSLH